MPSPLFSVVIPTFERLQFLQQCLQSVLSQAPGPDRMEIWVCDDASRVEIAASVKAWGGERVGFRSLSRHCGQWANVNEAVARAKGQWIHILHDDDFVLPGFYGAIEEAAVAAPSSVGVIACLSLILDGTTGRSGAQPPFRAGPGVLSDWLGRLVVANPVNMPAVVVRREVYEAVGPYWDKLPTCADWEFHIRSATQFDWWHVPQALACYRRHADSVTDSVGSSKLARDIRRTIERAEGYLPESIRQRYSPESRRVHARNFSAQAAQAFQLGQSSLGVALLREALALSRPLR